MNEPIKPATRYVAEAVEDKIGRRYLAKWASPGRIPEYVVSDGKFELFDTQKEAEDRAREVMFNTLNDVRRDPNTVRINREAGVGTHQRVKPVKMTSAELSIAMRDAQIAPNDLAYLWGTAHDRVIGWMQGADQVPFPIRWALALLKEDDNYHRAMDICDASVKDIPRKK